MSKVANYGLIILTPPLKPELWVKYQKIIGLSHPLHTACPFNQGKRQKPSGKNPPLNMDCKTKFGHLVFTHASQHDQQSPAVIWDCWRSSQKKTLLKMYGTCFLKMHRRVNQWCHHAQAVWCNAYGSQCAWFTIFELDHCRFEWCSDYHSR